MSADDWSVCPRCQDADDEKRQALKARIRNEYGVLPIDEWDGLREQEAAWPEIPCTFSEDYEWGHERGTVFGSYKGRCSVCSLSVEAKVDKTFYRAGLSVEGKPQ